VCHCRVPSLRRGVGYRNSSLGRPWSPVMSHSSVSGVWDVRF
jgi:hypothetical protein